MGRLEIIRQVATGLGEDLDPALDQPQFAPVGLERIERTGL
jgi:hypothetical protein